MDCLPVTACQTSNTRDKGCRISSLATMPNSNTRNIAKFNKPTRKTTGGSQCHPPFLSMSAISSNRCNHHLSLKMLNQHMRKRMRISYVLLNQCPNRVVYSHRLTREGLSLLNIGGDVKVEKKTESDIRSQSVDLSKAPQHMTRNTIDRTTPRNVDFGPQATQQKAAPAARAHQPPEFPPPSRTNSAPMGAKRPQLKVQIPSEKSDDDGSASAASSPHQSNVGDTPAKASTEASHSSSGVVLPPPSPSASAILSAGAQGPPNPFARPHPPSHPSQNSHTNASSNNNIETPISALPSRFVADGLLPSPSSFYPEWGFGRAGGESNMLPSPLNFQTPVAGSGPSFRDEDNGDKKRKSPEGEQEASNLKRLKT